MKVSAVSNCNKITNIQHHTVFYYKNFLNFIELWIFIKNWPYYYATSPVPLSFTFNPVCPMYTYSQKMQILNSGKVKVIVYL